MLGENRKGLGRRRFRKVIFHKVREGKVRSKIRRRKNFESKKFIIWGTAVGQWLRCCATNCKVAGSIPDGVIGICH